MNLLDFILLGFLVITLIIGLKRGFAKTIGKGLCVLVALAGSVVAALLLTDLVKTLPLYTDLQASATSWFAQPIMTTPISSHEQLSTLLASEEAGIFSVLGGLSEQIYLGFESSGAETLGAYLGGIISSTIVAFVIWLVAYIALKYIMLGLRKLICLLAGLPVLKSIDKIIGAVVTIAVGYVIVFGVLYTAFAIVCANFFPDLGAQVVGMVDQSMIFSYVHHTNFIGEFLCSLFKVDYATFSLVVPAV